ncbi:MAG TPA: hypothetical protein VGQ28_18245 [Thermoanaerobaculia bacterium]|nr:hypothetical protein [Thermoanaerobaculia bacterium]
MKHRTRPAGQDFEPLVRELRGSLASLRAASEALALLAPPEEDAEARDLRSVVLAEGVRLTELVDRLGTAVLPGESTARGRRPLKDLIAELVRSAGANLDLTIEAETGAAPPEVRLSDGSILVATLLGTLGRLRRDFAVCRITLRSRLHQDLVALDFLWPASEPELWRLRESSSELLAAVGRGGRGEPPLREVVQALGGEVWLTVDRAAASAGLRLLLPPA